MKELRDAEQLAVDPLDALIQRVERKHDAALSLRIAGALAVKIGRGDALTARERDRAFYTLWAVRIGNDPRHALGLRKRGRGRVPHLDAATLPQRAELVAYFWAVKDKKLNRTDFNPDSAFRWAGDAARMSWQTMRDAWKVHGPELKAERDKHGDARFKKRLERACAGFLRTK